LARCDLRRDPGRSFVAFDARQRQLRAVQLMGFDPTQRLQLVADLALELADEACD
jgi:hypothetical protein